MNGGVFCSNHRKSLGFLCLGRAEFGSSVGATQDSRANIANPVLGAHSAISDSKVFPYIPKSTEKRSQPARVTDQLGDTSMIRSELIQKIADENPHLYQRDVEKIVNTIFDEITEAMANGNRVELRGFGAFSVKKRDSRTGRNPRTGESVEVEEKHVPFFKTGKLLRDRLNGK